MTADRQRERGAAMVLALMLVFVAGAMITAVTQGSRQLATGTIDDRAELQALQAADGGIAQARWRLRRDPGYRGEVVRIGDAEVTVVVEPLAGDRPGWRARATARCLPRGASGLPLQRGVVADLVAGSGLPAVARWRELD